MVTSITSYNALSEASSELVGELIPFSGVLGSAFRTFQVAHFTLTCYENCELIRNRTSEYTVGAFLNITLGNRTWVRIGAQLVLVAKSLLRCIDAREKVVAACQKLANVWNGNYPIPIAYLQQRGTIDRSDEEVSQHFLSKLSILPQFLLKFALKIEALVEATFHLLVEAFHLSRSIADLYDAILFDRYTAMRAINGVVINGRDIMNRLTENPNELCQEIAQQERLMNMALRLTKSPITASDICSHIRQESQPQPLKVKVTDGHNSFADSSRSTRTLELGRGLVVSH